MRCKIVSAARDADGANAYLVVEIDFPGNVVSNPMFATNTYEGVPEWRTGADKLTEDPLPYLPVAHATTVFCHWPSRSPDAPERFLQILDGEPASPRRPTLEFGEATRTLNAAERKAAKLAQAPDEQQTGPT